MNRIDGRKVNELRKIEIVKDYTMHATGCVLISCGNTKVICSASIEEKVPPFLSGQGKGWVSAEYSMLPSSTITRKQRDIGRLKLDGRSSEIQRLIGRSLRSIVDLEKLGERTIWIDCDVIQADGGTRTASINGAFVALKIAIKKLMNEGLLESNPLRSSIAAISVGIVEETALLDLCYVEDSKAEVDMNIVMNGEGQIIEIQGTGEGRPFTKKEFSALMELAENGIMDILKITDSY